MKIHFCWFVSVGTTVPKYHLKSYLQVIAMLWFCTMYKMIKQVYSLTTIGLHLALPTALRWNKLLIFRIWFERRTKSHSVGLLQPII